MHVRVNYLSTPDVTLPRGKILCIRLTHPLLLYRIFNPLYRIFVISVSKLSTHVKTFVHGFLKKKKKMSGWEFLDVFGKIWK